MKNLLRGWLALVLLGTSAMAAAEVTLNLKDADINTLIQTVSEVTGKNFIVDPRVKGKVTVISSTPMDEDGLYETFLAVLQVQGFAAIPSGDTVKIVPETNARQDGGGFDTGPGLAIDEVVTHVYSIQNVSAAQLVPILRPLVPQWGHLAAYAPSNMLIISDRAANVTRLERLIRQIDQSGDRGIEVVKLQHASASEVVRVLTSISQGEKQQQQQDGGTTRAVAVIADERSNAVLVAGDRGERQKLLDIIAQLDIPVGEDGATQVVYLKFASAENLAPILEGYAQQVSKPATATGAAAATPAPAPPSGGGTDGVRVLADKDTNALIITAPPKTMRQIRDVIAQLDIRRAQVLVEGIIAEVSASKSSALGIDWAVFNSGRIAAAGILDPATLGVIQGLGSAAGSATGSSNSDLAALGLLGNGINIAAGSDGNTQFAILLKAIKGDGDSNVLSTPTLVTMDNEEAEISVGQEVPFLTGSFSNTGSGSNGSSLNPFQTIERKDVGLTLGITPQINEGNNIKLKLKLEVSSLVTGSTGGAVDLVTNKRTLTNTVSVEDGQVLVLGGLIDDNLNDTQRGVPFLSDIPLIGSLFKFRSISKNKRNLMVFIKPAILRKQSEGDYYSRLKYDSLRDLQRFTSSEGAVPLIGGSRILLEPYDAFAARGAEVREAAKQDIADEAAARAAAAAPPAAPTAIPAEPSSAAPTPTAPPADPPAP